MIDFIANIFPYLIGTFGIFTSFYTLNKTIKNQREIKSIEIKKDLRKTLLDEVIETYLQLLNYFDEIETLRTSEYFSPEGVYLESFYKPKIAEIRNKIKMSIKEIFIQTTNRTSEQIEFLVKINSIVNILGELSNPYNKHSESEVIRFQYLRERQELESSFLEYVEKERIAIENLITARSSNKFILWLKKSWSEVGEYKE